MKARLGITIALLPLLAACSSLGGRDTLAQLRHMKIEITEAQIEGGIEKAIASYRRFLEATPESAMTPEAIRRLADLKIEKEYGLVQGGAATAPAPASTAGEKLAPLAPAPVSTAGEKTAPPAAAPVAMTATPAARDDTRESEQDFERRATAASAVTSQAAPTVPLHPEAADAQQADALEAIALYQKLLAKYPLYERNDQVLYQMARAYEELGEVEEAMKVMNRLVAEFPQSRYVDEVQFRRGEYFFTRKRFLDAEEAYQVVVGIGPGSSFHELALYKLGWSFYKQELYEDGLHRFMALLDHQVASGTDFQNVTDNIDKKRIDDTFRVVSFAFSYLGGADAVSDYFNRYGTRTYEENVYSNLGEHYLEKRRYNDAALAYGTFVRLHPFHKASPRFDMRIIEIYKEGGFPKLVVDSNKAFARKYGLKSDYWKHFQVAAYPEVLGYLKQNLKELANHYHALYQDKRKVREREDNFREALTWYGEYLESFPNDNDSPPIHYQMADLLLENKDYAPAAVEYERIAYGYPAHEKAPAAGYAAVYAYREQLNTGKTESNAARREVVRSSLRFAESFPAHEKAAMVLSGAAEDLYRLKDHTLAAGTGRRVIEQYPEAEPAIVRAAWLVVAHASFDLAHFADAEQAYANVLQRTAEKDATRAGLLENLAASIYKQGEQATQAGDHATAAAHYLRIAEQAPASKIRPTAEFDAAAALIQLQAWDRAAEVLQAFRGNYKGHGLQPEVTKKIAYVYKEAGKLGLAAAEYERIESESKDEEVRRGALLIAADLYQQNAQPEGAVKAYSRYLRLFPKPLEPAVEARHRLAVVYRDRGDQAAWHRELRHIVDADARAGRERTERTRYLAATSALVLTEPRYAELTTIKLTKPFQKNLQRKKAAMKKALDAFGKLTDYEVAESTAAATYYIAEIYLHFSKALMTSERPDNLNALELEQYELAIEEQAFPFEEKAIEVHRKNLELLAGGIYNRWIDNSLGQLAVLMPARYARTEESSGYLEEIEVYRYDIVLQPAKTAADMQTAEASAVNVPVQGAGDDGRNDGRSAGG
ncbi:MAG: tetratricopeptide repeat protein [Gammaproteobacteria bacterium]|nr:tetratricopeptide repeat protein [Gammaproteobacteria bacterium]